MSSRRTTTRALKLGTQTAELMLAAPQVIAHRTARMAAAGLQPDARDMREFQRMGWEKLSAFNESWSAMLMQMVSLQQQWLWSWTHAWMHPFRFTPPKLDLQRSAVMLMSQGLAPVHKRATANARRLGKLKRR